METNIFKGAKFGDKFVRRDGMIAAFQEGFSGGAFVFTEDGFYNVYSDGKACNREETGRDIVSRYQEPIDEEKLDDLAGDSCKIYSMNRLLEYHTWVDGFKAGYKKAKEGK